MPPADIHRLIAPRSIALIGAGAWTDAVAAGNAAIGYSGALWRVHPTRRVDAPRPPTTDRLPIFPGIPDAAFIAVPNHEAPGVAGALAARGAGGFVCFSAGFSETGTESGLGLTRELVQSAGALPYFGPNCYGFVNFFDRVAMMPDQIVGPPVERGVALICQSGTIALTLMFNHRSLPIGCLFTVGNQTRLAVEDLIEILVRRCPRHGIRLVSGGDQGSGAICARRRRWRARRASPSPSSNQGAPPPRRAPRTVTPERWRARTRCSRRSAAKPALPAAIPWARCAKLSSCSTWEGRSPAARSWSWAHRAATWR